MENNCKRQEDKCIINNEQRTMKNEHAMNIKQLIIKNFQSSINYDVYN